MGKKKNCFKCLTGGEIFNNKNILLDSINSEKYDEFCKNMNDFWKKNKIEDQLTTPLGLATITKSYDVTAEYVCFFKKEQARSMEISSSELINKVKNGTVLAENAVYMAESKHSKFWEDILLHYFSLEKDLFDRFISDNGFYWDIGIEVMEIGRTSFCDSTPCIYRYRYVLFISCNEDDATVTNIKLGLGGLNEIRKAPKKIGLVKALDFHADTIYPIMMTTAAILCLIIYLISYFF